MATPRKYSKLSLKKKPSNSCVARPPPPPPPPSSGCLMRDIVMKKSDNAPILDQDKYSVITIMSEGESEQAKLRTPENIGERFALEELLDQLEGGAAHVYAPERVIATPHMSEVLVSPPQPPPPPPSQQQQQQQQQHHQHHQHPPVHRYNTGGKDMMQMVQLYADGGASIPRAHPTPKSPQELADLSYEWLQKMIPDYQGQLTATSNNIARLEAELEASRKQEREIQGTLIRIQEYLNFVEAQQKW